MLSTLDFEAHTAAIAQNAALATGLVHLFAPTFQAAVIAVQLPAERRSAQHAGWSWADVGTLVEVLSAEPLAAGLSVHLGPDGPCIGRSAMQLLQPACQLLDQDWPLGSDAGTPAEQSVLVSSCWALVRAVCAELHSRIASQQQQQGGWPWDDRAQRATLLLLRLLPRLAPLLLWLGQLRGPDVEAGFASSAAGMIASCSAVFDLLASLSDMRLARLFLTIGPAGEPSDVPPWYAAASAMLRSLPALADVAQQSGGQLPSAVTSLAHCAFQFAAGTVPHPVVWKTCSGDASLDPDLVALSAAVYQLHSDACRAVHWSQQALAGGGFELPLFGTLSRLMLLALQLPSQPAASSAWPRPMAAAHCAAIQTLLTDFGRVQQLIDGDAEEAARVTHALAAALAACPQSAAEEPGLPALLNELVAMLVQVRHL